MSLSVFTEDHSAYEFFPISCNQLNVRVKASHDAHVVLTSHPCEGPPCYEIFFGCFNNTRTIIRKNTEEQHLVDASTPGILSPCEFRSFWIRWTVNTISAGVEHDPMPRVSYNDSHSFPIRHFGVRTGWGSTGQWQIDQLLSPSEASMSCPQPPVNPYYPAPSCFPPGPPVGMKWVTCADGSLPAGAVAAGYDLNNETLYAARARHEGALLPGKFVATHKVAYVAWGGKEIAKHIYDVLCDCTPRWVPTTGGELPHMAVICGNSEDGESLYMGRVYHEGSLVPGKVQRSHGVCYIPFGGREISKPQYEILML